MTIHRRFGWTFWLAVAALALATACGGPDAGDGESTLERLKRRGVARVGYANEAPYAYYDNASGRLTGEAVEIARVVLERIGVPEVEGVLTEFGSLIPGLQADRFDLIAAGMYVTPERCRQIAFSRPTYGIGEAFIVRAGNPLGLHSYEELAEHPTARLGVVAGAIELRYARAVGIPDERILLFPDAPSAVEAVGADRIDAYGGTSLTVSDLLGKAGDSGLERAAPFTDPEIEGRQVRGYGAFGVRQDDEDLLRALNGELADFLGSPEHLELVRPFGFTEAELPGDVTADQLCENPEEAP